MSESPLVSVVLPVYNASEFLEESLNSILNQTYKNLEIIVIDDGSTDGSGDVVRKFNDPRIQLYSHSKNLGLITTLNEGFEIAKGKYIARMDADDVIDTLRLEKQVNFLEKNINVGMVGTWMKRFGLQEGITTYPTSFEEIQWIMLYRIAFCHASVLMKKSILREHNLAYDLNFIHAEDYDFGSRLIKVSKISNLPEALYYYRIHKKSVSHIYNEIQVFNTLRIVQRNLNWLGVEVNIEQACLFRRFADRAFDFTANELEMLEPVVTGLLASSSLPAYARHQVTERLWHLMLNARHIPLRQKILLLRRLDSARLMPLPSFWSQRILAYHLRQKIS